MSERMTEQTKGETTAKAWDADAARWWLYRTAGEIGPDGLVDEAEELVAHATECAATEREFRRLIEDVLCWDDEEITRAISEVMST